MPLLTESNAAPLNEEDILKLNAIGVVTVMDLLNSGDDLFRDAGVSFEKLDAVKDRFLCQYSLPIERLHSYQCSGLRIYEASKAFDDLNQLLSGGFYSQEITEIFGAEAAGKTHLCHHLAIDFALRYHKVLYVDTDASFSGRRIRRLLDNRRLSLTTDIENVLSRIRVRFLSTYHQLMSFIASLKEAMKTEIDCVQQLDPDIIIIDSIVTPLTTQFLSFSSFEERSNLLTTFIQELNSLFSIKKTLTIIAVNSEANWFGLQWKNACAVSLCLKYCDDQTVVTVEKSNRETNTTRATIL